MIVVRFDILFSLFDLLDEPGGGTLICCEGDGLGLGDVFEEGFDQRTEGEAELVSDCLCLLFEFRICANLNYCGIGHSEVIVL